jgi:transcription elongation GreA/GreB family factor
MALDKRQLLQQLATQLSARRAYARAELDALLQLAERGFPDYQRDSAVGVGALVDVWSTGERGDEARTLFVLPAGADTVLPGPRDKHFEVVTPASPVGKAVLGRKAGEKILAPLNGNPRTWTVLEVS